MPRGSRHNVGDSALATHLGSVKGEALIVVDVSGADHIRVRSPRRHRLVEQVEHVVARPVMVVGGDGCVMDRRAERRVSRSGLELVVQPADLVVVEAFACSGTFALRAMIVANGVVRVQTLGWVIVVRPDSPCLSSSGGCHGAECPRKSRPRVPCDAVDRRTVMFARNGEDRGVVVGAGLVELRVVLLFLAVEVDAIAQEILGVWHCGKSCR